MNVDADPQSSARPRWRLRIFATVGGILLLALLASAIRVLHVQAETGDWALRATKPDLRVGFNGRSYDRGGEAPLARLPDSAVRDLGVDDDGDTVYGRSENPIVMYVADDDGRIWTYALVGGP